MTHRVVVGVALHRPPRIDQLRAYEVAAGCWDDARLAALQMAACRCVMPVWAGIDEELPLLPEGWFR